MFSECYIIGQEMFQWVDGKGGEVVVDSLWDIVFDFVCYLIEFFFGDIYVRSGFDLCSWEIVIIVVFMVLGNVELQLKVYIVVGLNVGLM